MNTANLSGMAKAISDAEMELVLHPGRAYERPGEVVTDTRLSLAERRAILSSWASDACAVESNPLLRQPPCSSAPVTFEEIMDALAELDRIDRNKEARRTQKPLPVKRAGSVASQRKSEGGACRRLTTAEPLS
jgi:hypothetical protein